MSFYMFFISASIGNIRFFSKDINPINSSPEDQRIQVLNKVLQNTIEQMFIFIPLISFWILKYSNNENKHFAVIYGFLFILGRILFLIGYFIGFKMNYQTLRSFGMSMTYFSSLTIMLSIFRFQLQKIK